MPYAVHYIDLVYTIKNSNFMPELKQLGRAGKHWISSISTTPLHYLAIDHDVGRWGTYLDFFEIQGGCCPLTPSFPYLLLRHKIGLDFISGKGVNFKASSPHIFSRMSHICCLFTDMFHVSYLLFKIRTELDV